MAGTLSEAHRNHRPGWAGHCETPTGSEEEEEGGEGAGAYPKDEAMTTEAQWDGNERRARPHPYDITEDNMGQSPTWKWVAITAIGVIGCMLIFGANMLAGFVVTLHGQVDVNKTDIVQIKEDVRHIKRGVDDLLERGE